MASELPRTVVARDRSFDAVVFDLDGVLTDTAVVHLRAWSELFNAFLEERELQ